MAHWLRVLDIFAEDSDLHRSTCHWAVCTPTFDGNGIRTALQKTLGRLFTQLKIEL